MTQTEPNATTLGDYAWASKYLGLPKATLYALVHERRIPHVKFGPRFVRFSKRDLDAWIEQHSEPAKAR
jgi:excisionase family DNA binding protein